tara:strand:- start:280 stop:918 length:639 start_codon:yes stop_codon:yes gene_type:complete
MLIPTSFVKMPSSDGCHNGQIVMGGTVTQMANGLAQLTHCKFLGEAHYQVGHSTYYEGYSATYKTGTRISNSGVIKGNYKGYDYHFLYQSTARSEHLALLITYAAKRDTNTPDITCVLRDTSGNSYTGSILDHGIQFINLSAHRNSTSPDEVAFTGCELVDPPSNTSPTTLVRPLYVPSANRGDLLNISVTVNDVAISGFHIYDVYQVEVTP